MINSKLVRWVGIGAFVLAGCSGVSEPQRQGNKKSEPITQQEITKTVASSSSVNRLLETAQFFADHNRKVVRQSEFDFFELNSTDLQQLFVRLYEIKDRHEILAKFTFEVRDALIRLAIQDPQLVGDFKALSSDPVFEHLDLTRLHFFPSEKVAQEKSLGLPEYRGISAEYIAKQKNIKDSITVFHASIEAHNARVGGCGTYIDGLLKAEKNRKNTHGNFEVNGKLIIPFFDFLKKKFLTQIRFRGLIDHLVDGRINLSSIYELTDEEIDEYLIQPDPQYQYEFSKKDENGLVKRIYRGWDIADVNKAQSLYSVINNNVGNVYFPSAVAFASHLYRGESGFEKADVIQLNGRHFALASPLMALEINKKRELIGLPKIAILATTHDSLDFRTSMDSTLIRRAGLVPPQNSHYNPHVLLNVYSDMANVVSKSMVDEMVDTRPGRDLGVGHLFSALKKMSAFSGIINGLSMDPYDPRSFNVLGTLRVNPDFSNLDAMKSSAKKHLFDAGLIGSDTRPLFLFVGRIAWEKGVDVLAEFTKRIVTQFNGQVVIMGIPFKHTQKEREEWASLQADPQYKEMIRVYTDLNKDQLEVLPHLSVSKGNLLRFASEFTIIPSILEACGLVPLEALAMGSGVITSGVQGLKDLCTRPLDPSGSNIQNFTCIRFHRDPNAKKTIQNLNQTLDDSLPLWFALSDQERAQLKISWIREAETFKWDFRGGPLDQYIDLYVKSQQNAPAFSQNLRKDLINQYSKGLAASHD